MKVSDFLNKKAAAKALSFEVLPPLKGNGTTQLFRTIDRLREFDPNYINITTHNSEFVYRQLDNGQYERDRIRRRPGTIAIAAAIQQRYGIPVIPHIICSGATVESTEYELLDLQFLGIQNLLLLRGDKARDDGMFTPTPNGHTHTTELIEQVNRFNEGFFADGTPMKHPGETFEYGVACYPEKHEEAPNLDMDIDYLLRKQQLGAKYAVTQLFAKLGQLTVIPRTFHCDLPTALASEIVKCKTDDDAKALGVEWATQQCRELYAKGVPSIHFYTVSAVDSICEVAKKLL